MSKTYKLDDVAVWQCGSVPPHPISLHTPKRCVAAIDDEGCIYVAKGYEWDGATAAPDDFPWRKDQTVIMASLFHDVGCQFVNANGFPFSRREVDKWLHRYLKACGRPALAVLYYLGPRIAGGAHSMLHPPDMQNWVTLHASNESALKELHI